MAVFMPTTSPRTFSRGPPELPGLMAASVCSMSMVRPSVTGKGRLSALTTPTLTVWDSPNGLPMAMTQSPGCICAESPNLASGSAWSGFSVNSISALSVSGSRPTTRARYRMSSSSPYSDTSTLSAPSTTWLLVRMRPSLAMMKPVPAATVGRLLPRGLLGCPRLAEEAAEHVVAAEKLRELLLALARLGADVHHGR